MTAILDIRPDKDPWDGHYDTRATIKADNIHHAIDELVAYRGGSYNEVSVCWYIHNGDGTITLTYDVKGDLE